MKCRSAAVNPQKIGGDNYSDTRGVWTGKQCKTPWLERKFENQGVFSFQTVFSAFSSVPDVHFAQERTRPRSTWVKFLFR